MSDLEPYRKIVNPLTGRPVSVSGTLGRKILRNYQHRAKTIPQHAGAESQLEPDPRAEIEGNLRKLSDYKQEEFNRADQLARESHQIENQAHQRVRRARKKIGELVLTERNSIKTHAGSQPVCVLTKLTGTCEPNYNLDSEEYYHQTGKDYCRYNAEEELCEFGQDGVGHPEANRTRRELLQNYDADSQFSGRDSIFYTETEDSHLQPLYSYHNPTELREYVHGTIPDEGEFEEEEESDSDTSS